MSKQKHRKAVPAKFTVSDHAEYMRLVEALDAKAPARTRKALIAACPAELVGTAWDPVFANGAPVKGQAERKHVKPVRIVSFEC